MEIDRILATELQIEEWRIRNARILLEEGNTLPFIARYRKERTGALDETQLREIFKRMEYLTNLNRRKQEILQSIESQGKLTKDLKQAIESSTKLSEVEDLYLPYKKRKKTRADIALEKGLKPAADFLKSSLKKDEEFLHKCIQPDQDISSLQEVLTGANDIVAQEISENIQVRERLRVIIQQKASIESKKTKNEDPGEVFKDYYEFSQKVSHLKPFQILALNRGSKNKILKLSLTFPDSPTQDIIQIMQFSTKLAYFDLIEQAIEDSLSRLLIPSLFNETFANLLSKAQLRSAEVFAENLRHLLLQKPLKKARILGIDPGYRTGCKIVALDEYGEVLDHSVIYPHPPENKSQKASEIVLEFLKKYGLDLIVIGDGTASRETQQWVVDLKKQRGLSIKYAVVSEAGASVYSASKTATEEFPQYDVTTRGAISIARRVQDPLAELVKIPPESLGVGMYQHDIPQNILKGTLEQEVESVVNYVGINLNTASLHLLKYISGLNAKTAASIVEYRKKEGPFKSRQSLTKVSGVGPKAFEQAAGFCRVPESSIMFDNTTIHPENYTLAQKILEEQGITDISSNLTNLSSINEEQLAVKLEVQPITVKDIIEALIKKDYDVREEMPQIALREDILSIDDLTEGMILQGKITNVVDFGAFVDLGLKNSGLIHKSNIAKEYVEDPSRYLKAGQILEVKVISIDKERGRIGLSIKDL